MVMRVRRDAVPPSGPRLTMNASTFVLFVRRSAAAVAFENVKVTFRALPDGHWNARVSSVWCFPLVLRSLIVPFVAAPVDAHLTETITLLPFRRTFVFATRALGNAPLLTEKSTLVPTTSSVPGAAAC